MNPTRRTVCDVVGCDAPPTGRYLDASRAAAVTFAICDSHMAELRAGSVPAVLAGPDGERPVLLLGEPRPSGRS